VKGESECDMRLREMRERMHRPFLHIDPGPPISFLLLLLLLTRASLLSIFLLSSALTPGNGSKSCHPQMPVEL
jgi:hypothetical protein